MLGGNMEAIIVLASAFCLLVGIAAGYIFRSRAANADLKERQEKGDSVIEKAKDRANNIKQNARNEAKEIISKDRQQHDSEMRKRENNFKEKEKEVAQTKTKLKSEQEEIDKKGELLNTRKEEIEEHAPKDRFRN